MLRLRLSYYHLAGILSFNTAFAKAMSIDNKFPGKDISSDDLLSKFAAKSDPTQKTLVDVRGAVFGSDAIPTMCGPNTVESLDLILDCARHASSLM